MSGSGMPSFGGGQSGPSSHQAPGYAQFSQSSQNSFSSAPSAETSFSNIDRFSAFNSQPQLQAADIQQGSSITPTGGGHQNNNGMSSGFGGSAELPQWQGGSNWGIPPPPSSSGSAPSMTVFV